MTTLTAHPEHGASAITTPTRPPLPPSAAHQIPAVHYLLRDFLDWVASRPRTYAETMDAWRSHCPRLTIWEDALADHLVRVERTAAPGPDALQVHLTPEGHALVRETRK